MCKLHALFFRDKNLKFIYIHTYTRAIPAIIDLCLMTDSEQKIFFCGITFCALVASKKYFSGERGIFNFLVLGKNVETNFRKAPVPKCDTVNDIHNLGYVYRWTQYVPKCDTVCSCQRQSLRKKVIKI